MWPYSPKIPCSCLPAVRRGWDLHQTLPSPCPVTGWMRFTGCGAWDSRDPLGGSPTPQSSGSPLLTALLGCPAAGVVWPGCVEPPPAPADAVPPAGRRDGAQRHAPLQEEVRHHAALQAHLSRGLARPPTQDTKCHFVCTRWATGLVWGLAAGSSLKPGGDAEPEPAGAGATAPSYWCGLI